MNGSSALMGASVKNIVTVGLLGHSRGNELRIRGRQTTVHLTFKMGFQQTRFTLDLW